MRSLFTTEVLIASFDCFTHPWIHSLKKTHSSRTHHFAQLF